MPFKQGQLSTITCISSPSKPASNLILYKNNDVLMKNFRIIYEFDIETKKNLTKLIYTINSPDSNWNNAMIKCKQIYSFIKNSNKDITEKIQVYCKKLTKTNLFFLRYSNR